MPTPFDYRVQQAVHWGVRPSEGHKRRLVDQERKELPDRIGEGQLAPYMVLRNVF